MIEGADQRCLDQSQQLELELEYIQTQLLKQEQRMQFMRHDIEVGYERMEQTSRSLQSVRELIQEKILEFDLSELESSRLEQQLKNQSRENNDTMNNDDLEQNYLIKKQKSLDLASRVRHLMRQNQTLRLRKANLLEQYQMGAIKGSQIENKNQELSQRLKWKMESLNLQMKNKLNLAKKYKPDLFGYVKRSITQIKERMVKHFSEYEGLQAPFPLEIEKSSKIKQDSRQPTQEFNLDTSTKSTSKILFLLDHQSEFLTTHQMAKLSLQEELQIEEQREEELAYRKMNLFQSYLFY